MSYEIQYTDFINKGKIVIEDNTTNADTSLAIPGKFIPSYGHSIAENFLHLLENFANDSAPLKPVEGQLWYDTTNGVNQLKIYDGTTWSPSSGLKRSAIEPDIEHSIAGDLWINTDRQQLYMYTGSSWILIGPDYSDGLLSGVQTDTIVGTDNLLYTVLMVKIEDKPIIIISNKSFIPKTVINGFRLGIKAGINLTSLTFGTDTLKYNGTATKAENLIISNEVIPAGNFLRSDATSITNFDFRIKNNNGLRIGANNQLSLTVENESGVIQNNTNGSKIDFRLKESNINRSILTINSNQSIGINNSAPTESLDVRGNIRIAPRLDDSTTGLLLINNPLDSLDISTGSIVTTGGVGIALSANIGGKLTVNDQLNSTTILPLLSDEYQIGSATQKYSQIYATTFNGNLQGNVIGSLNGRATSADKLTSSTTFSVTGDVSAPSIEFNGQTGGNTKTFDISISNSFISNKESITITTEDDEILLNSKSDTPGLFKITKRDFLKTIYVMPIGAVLPYGGETPPQGWLICNGTILNKIEYLELWQVIKHNFRDPSLLPDNGEDTFALPDMRGRFPLGLDNMGNSSANRVNDTSADVLGGSDGTDAKTLDISHLPDHVHTMKDENGSQYYGMKIGAGDPIDDQVIKMPIDSGTGGTHGLTHSGPVKSESIGQELNLMNPYLALNYIIYTGK